jgi:RNA recognition motif-containing protein
MTIYISNLKSSITDQDLLDLFTPYGVVLSSSIQKDAFTGVSRGFGHVSMPDEDAARHAINALHHTSLAGFQLTVHEAAPKSVQKGSYKVGQGPVNAYKFRKS